MELQLRDDCANDELFQLMKAQMTTEQEQIFMISHYLYLQHGTDSTQFVVDFDTVWKSVEFARRDNAKRILVNKFIENIDYKIGAYQFGESSCNNSNRLPNDSKKLAPLFGGASFDKPIHGGQNKETILLTVDCFKSFCFAASTAKAKEIRTYYIKMENIMQEYYKNFKIKNNKLQQRLEISQNDLQQSMKETAIKRHEVLIESNKNKWVVYFCKMKSFDDGSFILKVGETIDIKNRTDALRCDFGTVILLDVFACENSIVLEKSLHNSSELVKFKYNKLEHKNKKMSTEAYHIPNQKEYETIVKFATTELRKYNNIEVTKLRIEEKKVDCFNKLISLCSSYEDLINVVNKLASTLPINIDFELKPIEENDDNAPLENTFVEHTIINNNSINESEEQDDDEEEDAEEINNPNENTKIMTTTANSTGPIVQIYHKNDLKTVVHVYNSIMEATRDFNYNNKTASFTAIKKAYQNKTLYLDYRWHFITNRQEPNLNLARDIGNTVITNERNQGHVAMLNIDKTKIIKVYKLAKDAAKAILQHPSAMCSAIKHSTPLNNNYWMRWEYVDSSLQEAFLQSNVLPNKQPNIRGTQIKQLHPLTNAVIQTFDSYSDVQKQLKISPKTIKKVIENNEIYKGEYRLKLA
jgi:hypothetical protein